MRRVVAGNQYLDIFLTSISWQFLGVFSVTPLYNLTFPFFQVLYNILSYWQKKEEAGVDDSLESDIVAKLENLSIDDLRVSN